MFQTYQYLQSHRAVSFPEIRFAPYKTTNARFVQDFFSLRTDATSVVFEDEFSFAHLASLAKLARNVSLPRVHKLTIHGHFTPLQLAQVVADFRRMAPALSRLYVRVVRATTEGIQALRKACTGMAVIRMRLLPDECTPELCAAVATLNDTLRLTLQKDSRTVKTPA